MTNQSRIDTNGCGTVLNYTESSESYIVPSYYSRNNTHTHWRSGMTINTYNHKGKDIILVSSKQPCSG
ncbi:Uncharacterized protein APZ42_012822 [Daphnia magna]|uniref:Uncharacterized protein n=1 Tax=Daphnia magna TaxID=35525 RepID=A0A0P4YM56_9CRUS|nr:Uncharacterized protein APZ42_012822 [Daphnia magna]